MRHNNRMKKLLSLLLMTMLIVSALPTALASQCPTADGTYREHTWGPWDIVQEATCSQSGQMIRYCSVCRESDTADIPQMDHSYGNWKTSTEATCAKEGKRTRQCTVCGYKQTDTIKKKAHSWGEWLVITEPTDSAAGLRERTCAKCKNVQQEAMYPDGTLKKGDKGDAVTALQTSLNDNGYDCGKADGVFGAKTEKAVKELEAVLGIEADGIAWPAVTKSLLNPQSDMGCTFEKWEASVPENGHGYYEEGETVTYGFFVTNTADTEAEMPIMLNVRVYDEMLCPGSEEPVAKFEGIMPGANAYETMDYTVTAKDVARGYIENTAKVVWNESDSGATVVGAEKSMPSNTLIIYTAPQEESETTDEPITRSFTLTDTAIVGEKYDNYFMLQNLNGDANHTFHRPNEISSDLGKLGFEYGVDGGDGGVWIWMRGTPTQADRRSCVYTMEVDDELWTIEIVITAVGEEGISLVKSCTSTPADPDGYVENETVSYAVLISNNSDMDLYNARLTDPLFSDDDVIVNVPAHSSQTVEYSYTVTAEDVVSGCIDNTAELKYQFRDGVAETVRSNTVRVVTKSDETRNSLHIDLASFEGQSLMVPGTELKGTLLCTNTGNGALDVMFGEIATTQGNLELNDVFASFPPESQNLMPSGSCIIGFRVTITEDDIAAGKVVRDFTIYAYAAGTGDYNTLVTSNTVRGEVEIGDSATERGREREPYVLKSEVSTPGDGREFYIENETVEYEITFVNCTDQTLRNVDIYDTMDYADYMYHYDLAYVNELAAGESKTCYHTYTVTAEDVEAGQIADFGYVEFLYDGDDTQQGAVSDEVITPTGKLQNHLYVYKEEISTPTNGSYYTEGETIRYKITYQNVGDVTLGETMIYDTLTTGGEIASAEYLNPSEQRECYFEYKVSKDDVELWGAVYNMAIGEYELDGDYYHCDSNTVISPTGADPEKITMIESFIRTPVLEGDCCVRSIEARSENESEYMLHYCADHYDTLTAVKAMVSAAATPKEELSAWQYARVLWQNDADAMSEALMEAANGPAKATVRNELSMFKSQVASHEAALTALHPDDPVLVAKTIAELYRNRCIDLCYELHTAPEDRADDFTKVEFVAAAGESRAVCEQEIVSVDGQDTTYKVHDCGIHALINAMSDPFLYTSGNSEESWRRIRLLWISELEKEYDTLISASPDASELLDADVRIFKEWLSAREAVVRLLYPGRSEITSQMMAQTVMNRVMELCGDGE